jgi:GNAT superfamily N-acetyltransferase
VAFHVRLATAADHPVFTRLFPELRVADPLATPQQFAERMLPRVAILEEDGEALGYTHWRLYGATTHVVHVVVDPRARGRRAGAALLEEVRRRAGEEGCTRWYLNVKKDNAAAIRLYERCGFAVELEGWAMSATWKQLATLPADTVVTAPRPLAPADDAAVATRFDLVPEHIALLRSRPGVVLLTLVERETPVAFAAFDPAYPGVYPLRLARPTLARPLFEALRPDARTPHVHVFVEGDRALHDGLTAAGAALEHATLRMGSPLP